MNLNGVIALVFFCLIRNNISLEQEERTIYYCYGISSLNQSVCSNRSGDCVFDDQCDCNPGYTGNECQYWDCYGIPSNDSSVCNGHGTCSKTLECNCDNYYYGEQCLYLHCFDPYPPMNQPVDDDGCGSHGTCLNPDGKTAETICTCEGGYRTTTTTTIDDSKEDQYLEEDQFFCDELYCHGKRADGEDTDEDGHKVCWGESHGICQEDGNCKCKYGWEGDECNLLSDGSIVGIFTASCLVGFLILFCLVLIFVCSLCSFVVIGLLIYSSCGLGKFYLNKYSSSSSSLELEELKNEDEELEKTFRKKKKKKKKKKKSGRKIHVKKKDSKTRPKKNYKERKKITNMKIESGSTSSSSSKEFLE